MTAVTDNALGLLGLARRGGNLIMGEEAVADACELKKARVVFLAEDAGETTCRRALRMTGANEIPLVPVSWTKAELGFQLGRGSCALAALTDQGLAAAVVSRLAEQDESLRDLADEMAEKNRRLKSRAKKKKTPAGKKPVQR